MTDHTLLYKGKQHFSNINTGKNNVQRSAFISNHYNTLSASFQFLQAPKINKQTSKKCKANT